MANGHRSAFIARNSVLWSYIEDKRLELMRTDPNVGAGLLANAECQAVHLPLIHRLREQARSHILLLCQLQIRFSA